MSTIDELRLRLHDVRSKIRQQSSSLGLETEPTLIIVTKNHPVGLVADLVSLGESNFGENRDQEAAPKARALAEITPGSDAQWHFVGQLQTNKVKSVLKYASSIHTLDRASLLAELQKRTVELQGDPTEVFIEVNLTDREDRGGVMPSSLIEFADRVSEVQTLKLAGLMAVATPGIDPRFDFERVSLLRQDFLAHFPHAQMLSMGMSGDYLEAMEFGATHLRIGTAITGDRAPQN